MNHDDPKLTAYALDALSPQERAEIEALLKEQPSAATEVAETREAADIMRQLFRAELNETLTPRRRDAILRAAANHGQVLPEDVSSKVITHPAWWRRASVWQAAAACAVFGFGVYAISVTLNGPSQKPDQLDGKSGIEVGVHGLVNNSATPGSERLENGVAPETKTNGTPKAIVNVNPGGTNILPTPAGTNIANIKVPGTVELPPPVAGGPVDQDPLKGASVGKRAPKEGVGNQKTADSSPSKTPSYAATNPGDQLTLHGDGTSITLSGDEARQYYITFDYLKNRWQEASSIRLGNQTYADLTRSFRHDGNATAGNVHRFVMIRCPYISVDVEFAGADGQPAPWPVTPETRIQKISKPYFEPESGK
jgi:hypothetical protein